MGNCWGSRVENKQTPSSTGNITSGYTSQTMTTNSSIVSSKSIFSASSGEDIYSEGHILPTPNLREFTLQELKNATRNFKPDNLLGEGGFGKVYKGFVNFNNNQSSKTGSELAVAIKKLNSESLQGFEEWQSEVNFLGRLSHPNLVRLIGYCWEDKDLLLVYEFMQKGSLESHLFGRGSAVNPLPWDLRLKAAIGAARGLSFLHTSDDRVIYRDVKASNILLDSSYNAKISDFGLAKLGPPSSQSHVTTRVMGTYGYAAPEYLATGHLYLQSDVYGFGVVLVEILTGLRAVDTDRGDGMLNLADWIKPHLSDKRKLKKIMDSKLQRKYPFKAATMIADLALKSLAHDPKARPSMQEIVETLEKAEAVKANSKVTGITSIANNVRPHGLNRNQTPQNSVQASIR